MLRYGLYLSYFSHRKVSDDSKDITSNRAFNDMDLLYFLFGLISRISIPKFFFYHSLPPIFNQGSEGFQNSISKILETKPTDQYTVVYKTNKTQITSHSVNWKKSNSEAFEQSLKKF